MDGRPSSIASNGMSRAGNDVPAASVSSQRPQSTKRLVDGRVPRPPNLKVRRHTIFRSMVTHLFVYGTLAPGRPNAHVLSDVPGSWTAAWVRGRLLQEGWGAAQGYPGIVIDDAGVVVEGYVLSSVALAQEWKRLDEFEGDQYERVTTQAHLANGQEVTAFLYQLRR